MKKTCWYHLNLCFAIGLCGMTPLPALAAQLSNGVESADTLAINNVAAGSAQTLTQKPDLYLQLIAGMQQRGLYYASLAHLDAFEARWPDQPSATLLHAIALRETGQAEAAKAAYGKLLHGPLAARAYHGLGLIAVRGGHIEDGSQALNRAAKLAPTDATILGDQGYAFLLLGNLQQARLSLFKAAELDGSDKRIGANLALLLALSGKPEQAQELMQRYDLAPRVRKEILARAAEARAEPRTTSEHPQ